MKIQGRKRLRTCLSTLLVVVCLLTSFLFVNIDTNAQDETDGSFYVLDEEGNPIVIEVPQQSMTSKFRSRMLQTFSLESESVSARSSDIGVLRFKSSNSGVVYFTEVDTGRRGYFNCNSAADAAYLRTEGDYYICKLSGVVMKVHKDNVKTFSAYANCGAREVSYYQVSDNGYLLHYYTYYTGGSVAQAVTRVGYKQTYLATGTKYYSYDGHYFYTDFAKMIQDYRGDTYANAVNASTPYYNYYQYLSFHATAPFTAEQYNSYIASKNKPTSKLLTAGSAFVAAQNTYTVNALLVYGIAINESGWGTSAIALNNNKIFGWNAGDSSPGESAEYFASVEQCIKEFAYYMIHVGYLDGMDSRYRGPHLGDKHSGLNVKYASDPYWGEKAASHAYFFDAEKVDYGRYTIGIAKSGMIRFYKEADTSSTEIYSSDASDGTPIYDSPVTVLEKVTGSGGKQFYKVVSDMSLKDDRSGKDLYAHYKSNRDYVYVQASDVQIVFEGSETIIPSDPSNTPGQNEQGKTHAQVLDTLQVKNSSNYLTGFSVGGDISTIIAKVRALDSNIGVVVKNPNGTQVTSGMIATGMKMTITTNGSTVDYTLVVRGDVSGDGKLSAIDYVKVRNYLDGASSLSGAYLKGADTNGDGKVSALDYVKVRNHLDNKSVIVQ